MTNTKTEHCSALRERAEKKLHSNDDGTTQTLFDIESLRLLHELQVNKIELDMQNEELLQLLAAKSEHEEYLLNIIKKTPSGYFSIDREGYFTDVNDAWLRMHGYDSPEEVIGKHFSITFVDRNHDEAYEHLARLLKGEVIPEGEIPSLRKDGSVSYHIFSARPVVHGDNVVRLEWFIIDITKRKIAENALLKSEERYRSILQTAMDGFWLVAPGGKLLQVNETYCRMSGYSKEELLSMNITDLEVIETSDDTVNHIKSIKEQGEVRFESKHRRKDGIVIDVEISVQYRPDDGGQCVAFIRDITEQKKADKAKQVLEKQLHQAQKMETVGTLAGGVAHDFNNKLMVIMGNAELAKMHIDDRDKVLIHLEEINRAAEYSRDITFRLLAFSRQQIICPQTLNANHVIADELKSLTRLIGENIVITFIPDENLWNIQIDPVQLDQIVMNMAVNAWDAMPDGGALAIESNNVTMDKNSCSSNIACIPGEYVCITFSDSGFGMDQETLLHIFEPFFTTKGVGKGTGLGLATIYGIVSQNNGYINVTSTPGRGTTFKVYIPRYDAPSTDTIKVENTLNSCSGSILLVEDEDAVRRVTGQFLKIIGYTVYEAENPSKALEIAHDLSIQLDVVLTDFIMPGMNGKILTERIREIRPDIKCIFASGYSTDHVALAEAAISGNNFIQKPYDLKKLYALLKRVINLSLSQEA